jgi:hypothetical protein
MLNLEIALFALTAVLSLSGWAFGWLLHRQTAQRLAKLDAYTPQEILRRVESLEVTWGKTQEQIRHTLGAIAQRERRRRSEEAEEEEPQQVEQAATVEPNPPGLPGESPSGTAIPYGSTAYWELLRKIRGRTG